MQFNNDFVSYSCIVVCALADTNHLSAHPTLCTLTSVSFPIRYGLEWWPTSPATYYNGVGCKCGLAGLAKANRVGTYYGIDPEELDGVWRSVYLYVVVYNSLCHGLRKSFLTCASGSLQQCLMKRGGRATQRRNVVV